MTFDERDDCDNCGGIGEQWITASTAVPCHCDGGKVPATPTPAPLCVAAHECDDFCREPAPDGHEDCGGIFACHECRADAWAAGRLRHTDACQIRQDPPEGFPFDSFSCNCNGELVPAWLVDNLPGVDNWEPIDSRTWRGRSQHRERTWIYAYRSGDRWAALPVTEEAVEDGGVLDHALNMLREGVAERD